MNVLNSREIAITLWIIIFVGWAIWKMDDARSTISSLLSALFVKPIIIAATLMFSYVMLLVVCYQAVGLWSFEVLKETIIWTFSVAFVMLMNMSDVNKKENYFRNVIIDNLKLIVLLEFVIDFFVFSLWIELLIVPTATMLFLLKAVSETNAEYKIVDNLLGVILAALGFFLAGRGIYYAISDFWGFATPSNIQELVVIPLLTIGFLPFMYIVALYSEYEQILVRLRLFHEDKKIIRFTIWRIFRRNRLNLYKLRQWRKKAGKLRFDNRDDVIERTN